MMIFENGTKRIFAISVVILILVSAAGCQNGKCKSCLFDRNKEVIDEGTRGQVNQDPPLPPRGDESARLDEKELAKTAAVQSGQSNSIVLSATPTNSGLVVQEQPAEPLASNAIIPNAASAPVDAASQQPSLGAIPDAHGQTRQYAEGAASAAASGFSAGSTVAPQYQSVAPVIRDADNASQSDRLGFAPSSQDHSSSLPPEVKSDDSLPPAPNTNVNPQLTGDELAAPLPAELRAQTPEAAGSSALRPAEPPAESTSAPNAGAATVNRGETTYVPRMRDQYVNDLAVATREPVTLKGQAHARYIDNSASASTAIERRPTTQAAATQAAATQAAATPTTAPQYAALTPSQANKAQLVPNGKTSQIAPGVQLGVIDLTQQGAD